jgi:hypothetical protein
MLLDTFGLARTSSTSRGSFEFVRLPFSRRANSPRAKIKRLFYLCPAIAAACAASGSGYNPLRQYSRLFADEGWNISLPNLPP